MGEHSDRTSESPLAALAEGAEQTDTVPTWPAAAWGYLQAMSGLRWAVPTAYGGLGLTGRQLLEAYEPVARHCLTTCFLLSQRDAAIRRLLASADQALATELLPPLARGERFATVGIAQITTSRQHLGPALKADWGGAALRLNGVMPWVTGAERAEHIVAGAVLDDGQQLLVVVPTDRPGMRVEPALELAALQGSCTAAVNCRDVVLDRRWLLAGPAERVLGGDATGGLTTSTLALGLAGAALNYLQEEALTRAELVGLAEGLIEQRELLWQELLQQAERGSEPEAATRLRANANQLVLRATQAALTASKGTGFVRPHPAQRWARQALFFLVWSCPRPAAEAMLQWLAEPLGA